MSSCRRLMITPTSSIRWQHTYSAGSLISIMMGLCPGKVLFLMDICQRKPDISKITIMLKLCGVKQGKQYFRTLFGRICSRSFPLCLPSRENIIVKHGELFKFSGRIPPVERSIYFYYVDSRCKIPLISMLKFSRINGSFRYQFGKLYY